jgi:hypothetical protein
VSDRPRARILLVRPWTATIAPVRAALRDAGISATITRIDIEPALNAALGRGTPFDVIVHDPGTPGLPLSVVEARLREHRRVIPIVSVTALDDIVVAVWTAIESRLN